MSAIEVEDLFKSYEPVDAVRGISFRVEEGEVFALLGPEARHQPERERTQRARTSAALGTLSARAAARPPRRSRRDRGSGWPAPFAADRVAAAAALGLGALFVGVSFAAKHSAPVSGVRGRTRIARSL
jgi:hypothetical protein